MHSDRPATHWHSCWRLHLPCAVARIEEQTALLLQVTAQRDAARAEARDHARDAELARHAQAGRCFTCAVRDTREGRP